MQEITGKAYAKINLSLNVLGKRPDGYHDIESVMQPLDFGDDVTVRLEKEPGIRLSVNRPELPLDEGNIAYRAAALLQSAFELQNGISIHIHKRIPIAAGLAGGSADAAAVLKLLNRLCDLRLSPKQLAEFGLQLGADVPFCLYEKPALAEGIGERLTPVAGLSECYIVLVNPGEAVSTAAIYREIDTVGAYPESHTERLLSSLKEKQLTKAFEDMYNAMEKAAVLHCPSITGLLTRLRQAGAGHAMMSGSGATCFGIFTEKPDEAALQGLFGKELVTITRPLSPAC